LSRRSPIWRFTDKQGGQHEFSGEARLTFDELQGAAEAVEAGIGVACLPDYIVGESLTTGRLITLLPEYEPAGREVKMVYPHRQYLPTKVRLFIDFILSKTEDERKVMGSG